MPNKTSKYQHEPDDLEPDITQLATSRLVLRRPREASSTQQIAHYEAEIQRLHELAEVIEQAVTALVFRLHSVTDPRLYEPLEHNRADLQRYKDELTALQAEFEHAIERLQAHT